MGVFEIVSCTKAVDVNTLPDRINHPELFPEFHGNGIPVGKEAAEMIEAVSDSILDRLESRSQPSAADLLEMAEEQFGWQARWMFWQVIHRLRTMPVGTGYLRDYIRTNLTDDEVREALAGGLELKKVFKSTLDELVRNSRTYRGSGVFAEMIQFTARFKDYAPFNNLLIKLQNPSCRFYATQRDWRMRFRRELKDDARPLLILAPMSPVMLVYDIDQTEGGDDPQLLRDFCRTEGEFKDVWMENLLHNAERDRILIQFKELGSSLGGFATTRLKNDAFKIRIAVHNGLAPAAAFSVLCHELAHIYLGHLGGDADGWWPCRINLSHSTVEIEAEATSYIAAVHLGLRPVSEAYLSSYLKGGDIPGTVSVDLIAKRAGKLLEMAQRKLPERKKA